MPQNRKVSFTVFPESPGRMVLTGYYTGERAIAPMHEVRSMRPPKYYKVEVYGSEQENLPPEYKIGEPTIYHVRFRDLTFRE